MCVWGGGGGRGEGVCQSCSQASTCCLSNNISQMLSSRSTSLSERGCFLFLITLTGDDVTFNYTAKWTGNEDIMPGQN